MIGDNLNISIELKESKDLESLRDWILFALKKLVYGSKLDVKVSDEINRNGKEIWEEYLLDYDNPYNVPANFGITYIPTNQKTQYSIVALGAMNHPAGELLSENGSKLCELLDIPFIKSIVLTDNVDLEAPEILQKHSLGKLDPKSVIYGN